MIGTVVWETSVCLRYSTSRSGRWKAKDPRVFDQLCSYSAGPTPHFSSHHLMYTGTRDLPSRWYANSVGMRAVRDQQIPPAGHISIDTNQHRRTPNAKIPGLCFIISAFPGAPRQPSDQSRAAARARFKRRFAWPTLAWATNVQVACGTAWVPAARTSRVKSVGLGAGAFDLTHTSLAIFPSLPGF